MTNRGNRSRPSASCGRWLRLACPPRSIACRPRRTSPLIKSRSRERERESVLGIERVWRCERREAKMGEREIRGWREGLEGSCEESGRV